MIFLISKMAKRDFRTTLTAPTKQTNNNVHEIEKKHTRHCKSNTSTLSLKTNKYRRIDKCL